MEPTASRAPCRRPPSRCPPAPLSPPQPPKPKQLQYGRAAVSASSDSASFRLCICSMEPTASRAPCRRLPSRCPPAPLSPPPPLNPSSTIRQSSTNSIESTVSQAAVALPPAPLSQPQPPKPKQLQYGRAAVSASSDSASFRFCICSMEPTASRAPCRRLPSRCPPAPLSPAHHHSYNNPSSTIRQSSSECQWSWSQANSIDRAVSHAAIVLPSCVLHADITISLSIMRTGNLDRLLLLTEANCGGQPRPPRLLPSLRSSAEAATKHTAVHTNQRANSATQTRAESKSKRKKAPPLPEVSAQDAWRVPRLCRIYAPKMELPRTRTTSPSPPRHSVSPELQPLPRGSHGRLKETLKSWKKHEQPKENIDMNGTPAPTFSVKHEKKKKIRDEDSSLFSPASSAAVSALPVQRAHAHEQERGDQRCHHQH
ncbi:hypothetical protein MSG28_011057 [Choristoneura fumiferana]|uniref:Uncharacterized protein n=1 Tax=Choristoneura fumiferana TaxID=7141 RepID=A0ACC0KQ13_CHOFU|nr:hypothetical protein MSG28_011057 [Choristoneura fumiferana]